MLRAWLTLAVALGCLAGLEFFSRDRSWPVNFRPTAFIPREQGPSPTPWPTPPRLPVQPGKTQTSAASVRHLLAPPPPGERRQLRAAYFGDSIIEGDLICATLREKLRRRFGGEGVGWVGLAPVDAWAREDITQTFNAAWDRHAIFKAGWEGQAFGPGGLAWRLDHAHGQVSFKAPEGLPGYKELAPATLWYGPLGSEGADLEWSVDGRPQRAHLAGDLPLNAAVLSRASSHSLSLDLSAGTPQQPFYGVSFDQGSGIDNYSTRGSHGGPLRRMDLKMLQALQERRRYQLVLVQYGINALDIHSDPQYRWYRKDLVLGLAQLQAGLPGAHFVLITAIDRGVHGPEGWNSDPYLPGLLAAQEAAAADVGIPCINGFDLMGGPGSMKAWVEGKPRLAEHDYTHLSPLGGRRFGEALWGALENLGQPPSAGRP